ncbi:chitinase [Photobacterium halotolerans]|uniref:chitinase n=1 Tax=Photobacterium halotolerans TaxID=265726 RepID=UPI0009E2110A|nr:glycoside hydrolase family 19 protein [Photobacterium halotolerans]
MNKQKERYLTSLAGLVIGLSATGAQAYTLTQSEVNADEAAIIAAQPEGLQLVRDAIRTLDNASVEAITVGAGSNPDNVKRVESIVSESDWQFLFPERNEKYTYLNFLKGIGKFPAFCGNYTDGRDADAICRKSLATMFAHFTQETGGHNSYSAIPEWRQGLFYLREVGWTEEMSGGYGICAPGVWQADAYPCGTNADGTYKSYFGRGAKQLSYNYNYGSFSQMIYGDVSVLLEHPDRVADTWLNLASAVFFYLYPQPPKPSMLHVIDGTWQPNAADLANGLVPGFGVTTQIINGGVECGGSAEHILSQNRINYYREFASYLNVPVPADEVLGCAAMKQFDGEGAGALAIYWEQDWGWRPDTPDNQTYRCQLVNYQGPYSAFIAGDYAKCVSEKFGVDILDDTGPVAPVANAGSDVTVVGDNSAVTLDGSQSSDANDDIVSYSWVQTSGPALSMSNANQALATVMVPEVAEETQFEFTLTVTDSTGLSASDFVVITAKVVSDNQAPVVTLTASDTATAEQEVTVSAAISDADDTDLTINWSASNDLTLQISPDQRSATFTAPVVTVETPVTVSVAVSDPAGNSVTATKTVTVQPAGETCAQSWLATAVYVAGDTVVFAGQTWQAQWWTQGNEPGAEQWGPWTVVGNASCTGETTEPVVPVDPSEPTDPEEITDPAEPVIPGDYPAYEAGTAYAAGDKVSAGGVDYQCKPYPYSAWCSGAAWAYAPGTGTAWQDAWTVL